MRIEHLEGNFEKRKITNSLVYKLGEPATEEEIKRVEKELEVSFPDQLSMFYRHHNGLSVEDPSLKLFSLEALKKKDGLVYFSVFDEHAMVCFDTTTLNNANQWDIICCDSSFLITLTFSSFWSNKIWAWIDKKRKIWAE